MSDGWEGGRRERVAPALVVGAVVAVTVVAGVVGLRGEPAPRIPVVTATPTPAPAVVGVARVAGIDLAPDAELLADCRLAATVVGHAVPCSPRHPTGGELVGCVGTCLRGGGYVTALRRFEVPSRWCEGCVPELVVAAAPADAPALVAALTACGPRTPAVARAHGLAACRSEPVAWAGLAPHAGNTLRRGRLGDVVVAVSADGHGQAQAALVNHVFDHLVMVPAASPPS